MKNAQNYRNTEKCAYNGKISVLRKIQFFITLKKNCYGNFCVNTEI